MLRVPAGGGEGAAAYRRSVDRFLSLRRDVVEDEEEEVEEVEAAEATAELRSIWRRRRRGGGGAAEERAAAAAAAR